MDGYQQAARDFLMTRYALFALLFGLAIMVEGFTRDIGGRNAVLSVDSWDTPGLVVEVVPQAEVDKVTYLYRIQGEAVAREGIFRFEHWRAKYGAPRYEVNQQMDIAYSPNFPDISYPRDEMQRSHPDMVMWLGALIAGVALIGTVVWNIVDHFRFTKYLKWN